MPTYHYRCQKCQKDDDVVQKITENALTKCPHCGSESYKRVPVKNIAIQFTGSGFYKTDYCKPNSEKS